MSLWDLCQFSGRSPEPSESLPDHHCDIPGSRPPWGKALQKLPTMDKLIAGHQCRKGPLKNLKDSSTHNNCVQSSSLCLFCVFCELSVFCTRPGIHTNHVFRFIKQRKSEAVHASSSRPFLGHVSSSFSDRLHASLYGLRVASPWYPAMKPRSETWREVQGHGENLWKMSVSYDYIWL